MTARLPGTYFDQMYVGAEDPWQLSSRWYEQRKYAITLALLPERRYRHVFEPGCSIGTLTAMLAQRCDHVTALDVADAAVRTADARLREAGCRDRVTLIRGSLDATWPFEPSGPFDLVVLSEVAYYLEPDTLAEVLRRECPRLRPGDTAHAVIAGTPGLKPLGRYRDHDVVVEVFDTGDGRSVAAHEEVPGAQAQ